MIRTLLCWLTVGWAALLLSSLISMMAVFLGSDSSDLRGLLNLQSSALPFALIAIVFYVLELRRRSPPIAGARLLWRATPGWLVFVVASAASLAFIGELALLLVAVYTDSPRPGAEHVPALTAMLSSMALALAVVSLPPVDQT